MTSRRPPPEPEPIELSVLHEDEWLVAVDKPAGMVVHPTYKNWSGTLVNALLWRLRSSGLEPHVVTRLDRDTSGIVLVALTPGMHARLQRESAARKVRKEYIAVVCGAPHPAKGSIALPLARSPEDRRRVVVSPDGQPCQTDYELVGGIDAMSIVRCELVTGRTHQIRVHLAACGWPILGDPVYGTPDPRLPRQALHAWRLVFTHPVSGQALEIEAPVPSDLQPFVPQNLTL